MRGKSRVDARPGVVLETGAAHVRVATTEGSEVILLPNAIGRTRPGARRQVLVGDLIESECLDYGGLQLRLPIDRGLVVDWQAQKAVWDRALVRALGCSADTFGALRGHTVIVTEPYFLLPEQQRAFDMLLFEWYEADAVWRTTPAQLVPHAVDPCPDAMVVVDVGHSYTHAVPVVQDTAQWDAAQRLDMGGKVLTHLLKVMFSFRQWNMMDETYLTDKMKAASCFVAARSEPLAYRRGDEPDGPPSSWSFEHFVEHFHRHSDNAMVQQYVLPDYATPDDVKDPKTKYGYVLSGPAAPTQAVLPDDELDAFIAGPSRRTTGPQTEHQVLRLGQERYQLFEYLFSPERIGTLRMLTPGLEQGPLHELVAQSIQRAPPAAQDMLWSHVVLTGGSARVPGLRQRLEHELRMLAPDDVPVRVYVPGDPLDAPARGALALLHAPPTSAKGQALAGRLVTREAWQKHGGGALTPGERGGTALGDQRFGGWNAILEPRY
ncbi:Actin- protein 6 [Malassezia caprae]|uniref:Actin- protein 6 n=1 Tax=Malassezia caprae TaxID=1381934 RepID=A0AAF0E6L4_9BASI|nr:Actin- protein 6 [Malassezia caprae]